MHLQDKSTIPTISRRGSADVTTFISITRYHRSSPLWSVTNENIMQRRQDTEIAINVFRTRSRTVMWSWHFYIMLLSQKMLPNIVI